MKRIEHLIGDRDEYTPGVLGPHVGAIDGFSDATAFPEMLGATMGRILADPEKLFLLEEKQVLRLMVLRLPGPNAELSCLDSIAADLADALARLTYSGGGVGLDAARRQAAREALERFAQGRELSPFVQKALEELR